MFFPAQISLICNTLSSTIQSYRVIVAMIYGCFLEVIPFNIVRYEQKRIYFVGGSVYFCDGADSIGHSTRCLEEKGKVVMSADTLVIEAEGGLDEVWLVCVKAPQVEAKEQLADEAREFVVNEVLGNDVWIVFDNPRNEPRRNRDGRYMAFVYYEKVVEVGPKKEPTRSFFLLECGTYFEGFGES